MSMHVSPFFIIEQMQGEQEWSSDLGALQSSSSSSLSAHDGALGITTGTCAAAAAYGALSLLVAGTLPDLARVKTPQGVTIDVQLESCAHDEVADEFESPVATLQFERPWACVYKDAGKDPDITHGLAVCAQAWYLDDPEMQELLAHSGKQDADQQEAARQDAALALPLTLAYEGALSGSCVLALEGIGTVTRPGLKVAAGYPAINPGPQAMLAAVLRAFEVAGLDHPVCIGLAFLQGKALSKRTYNERLGILGGLSVLGTTGFVRPMSCEALIDSLLVEVDVCLAASPSIALCFGAQGEKAAIEKLGVPARSIVQVSNYVGEVFDGAVTRGARRLAVIGHPGKLVKLSAAIMNTHSAHADGRAEILVAHAALCGAPQEALEALWKTTTTEAAIAILEPLDLVRPVFDAIAQRAKDVLEQRARRRFGKDIEVAVTIVDQKQRVLAQTHTKLVRFLQLEGNS